MPNSQSHRRIMALKSPHCGKQNEWYANIPNDFKDRLTVTG